MNWELKECLDLTFQLLTLLVTFYFTYQLVKNDNNRERRALEDHWYDRFKVILGNAAIVGDGRLQSTGKSLLTRHPKYNDLVFEAYFDFSHENPSATKYGDFVDMMASYSFSPKDFKP